MVNIVKEFFGNFIVVKFLVYCIFFNFSFVLLVFILLYFIKYKFFRNVNIDGFMRSILYVLFVCLFIVVKLFELVDILLLLIKLF